MGRKRNWAFTQFNSDKGREGNVNQAGAGFFFTVFDSGGGVLFTSSIVQFTVSYAINTIPRGTAIVAIGRNARTNKLASINQQGDLLLQWMKVTISGDPRGEWSPEGVTWESSGLTNAAFFRGFLCGFNFRKMQGRVVAVVQLIGDAVQLTASSALTADFHQSTPVQLAAPAALRPGIGTGPLANVSSYIDNYTPASQVGNDVPLAIKTFLVQLANQNTVQLLCSAGSVVSSSQRANDRALKYLGLIEGPGQNLGAASFDYSASKAFGLSSQARTAVLVDQAITNFLGGGPLLSFANQTLWDVLIGTYLPPLGLVFSPLVNRGLILPDVGFLRGPVWRTLKQDEYNVHDMDATNEIPLRGVGVYAGAQLDVNSATSDKSDDAVQVACFGGLYIQESVAAGDGVIMPVPAPIWLANLAAIGAYGGEVSGVTQNKPERTATTPNVQPGKPSDPTPGQALNKGRSIFDSYAQMIFAKNTLRGRQGTISGKFRLDIAPGSLIQLDRSGDLFSTQDDALASSLVGYVTQVTISLDAETGQAGTAFRLAQVRTTKENGTDRASSASHPLYDVGGSFSAGGKGLGAALIPEYAFPPAN